jgi:hypothetical protein
MIATTFQPRIRRGALAGIGIPFLAALAAMSGMACVAPGDFDAESVEEELVANNEAGLDTSYRGSLSIRGLEGAELSSVGACDVKADASLGGTSCMTSEPGIKHLAASRFKNFYPGDATACGICIKLHGASGVDTTIELADDSDQREVDPQEWGHFEVTCELFTELRDQGAIRFDEKRQVWAVQWYFTPCEEAEAVQYRFKSGSRPNWLAIQPAEHRWRIVYFALRSHSTGLVVEPSYLDDNGFWVFPAGAGAGPFDVLMKSEVGKDAEDPAVFTFNGDVVQPVGNRVFNTQSVSVTDDAVTVVTGNVQL